MEAIFEAVLGAVFEAVIGPVLATVGYLMLTLLVYAVGVPLLYLICTPVVLIMACFGPGTYGEKVFSGYNGVWAAARSCGGPVSW